MNKPDLEFNKIKKSDYFLVIFTSDYTIFHAVGFKGYPRIKDIYKEIHNIRQDESVSDDIYEQRLDILTQTQMLEIAKGG